MLTWLTPLVLAVATAIGTYLGKRNLTPKDHERAALLDAIARGAAALVVMQNPGKSWADLLELAVGQISNAAGAPTKNVQAIERAAAQALTELGVKGS